MSIKIVLILVFCITNASAFKLNRKERGVDENHHQADHLLEEEEVEKEALEGIKNIGDRFAYQTEGEEFLSMVLIDLKMLKN